MLRIKVKKRFPSRSNFYHYCLSRNIEIRNFFPVQTGILERLVLGKNIKIYLCVFIYAQFSKMCHWTSDIAIIGTSAA